MTAERLTIIDADLAATRTKWLTAVAAENRDDETRCMKRLNFLLAQRHGLTSGRPVLDGAST